MGIWQLQIYRYEAALGAPAFIPYSPSWVLRLVEGALLVVLLLGVGRE